MSSDHWPLILVEGVMVFGGALAFGWWQLRSVRKDREEMLRQRELQAQSQVQPPTQSQTRPPPQDPQRPG